MEDNWFHVRSLLEALRVEAEGRPEHDAMVKLIDGAEKNFVATFSLIRCGSDDPMPWMLVVAVAVVVCNLIADISYAVLDPRVRLS